MKLIELNMEYPTVVMEFRVNKTLYDIFIAI